MVKNAKNAKKRLLKGSHAKSVIIASVLCVLKLTTYISPAIIRIFNLAKGMAMLTTKEQSMAIHVIPAQNGAQSLFTVNPVTYILVPIAGLLRLKVDFFLIYRKL